MAPADARKLVVPRPIATDEDAEHLAAFVAECVPPRERNGLMQLLSAVGNRGIEGPVASLFDGQTKGGPYRCCTEPRACRPGSRKVTAAIDKLLLGHPLLKKADVGIIDVATSEWPGHSLLVLKAALRTPRGVLPVECARAENARDLFALAREHVRRLAGAGVRVPQLTTSAAPAVVDMMLAEATPIATEWTGPVSRLWALNLRGSEWVQPASAETLNVAEALDYEGMRLNDEPTRTGSFAFARVWGDRLLVAHRAASGKHYLHLSLASASRHRELLRGIESRVQRRVAEIEQLGSVLDAFPIERLRIPFPKLDSYRHITRRVLLAPQFALAGGAPPGRPSAAAQPAQRGQSV